MTKHYYLAGPMRGFHLYNMHGFARGAWDLRAQGHKVFNPMERDLVLGDNPLEPHMELEDQDFDLVSAMTADLQFVCSDECDGVVLLDGWEESVGARLEVLVALTCGKKIYNLVEGYTNEIFPKIDVVMKS